MELVTSGLIYWTDLFNSIMRVLHNLPANRKKQLPFLLSATWQQYCHDLKRLDTKHIMFSANDFKL